MVEYKLSKTEVRLSILFKCLSDATRRSLLTVMCQEGPCRVTDLASRYDMSLNAISKHIKTLENAGLVTRRTVGRTHLIEADLSETQELEEWFQQLKSIWELRLNKLHTILEEEKEND